MKKLRTFFGIDDDLQAFAEEWMSREGQLANAQSLTLADGALVSVLYREGHFQVEMCAVPGGLVIPPHTHPQADTIEVGIAGALRLTVNGVDPFSHVPDERLPKLTKGRGLRINHNDVHGTVVTMPGSLFLSIQRWTGEPKSVLTDYSGAPLGPQHEGMLR
jgi:hypothetical protein